jgi:hypothetical protein
MDATDRELLGIRYYGCLIDDLYNRSRRHSTLAYKSPTQFMHDWIAIQHEQKTAA